MFPTALDSAREPFERAGIEPRDGTPLRLLDTAEALVAERGVEAVSLRAVTIAADANVASVHYHFGSKQALLTAVLERRMARLADERYALLAPLEQAARPAIRDVVSALVVPLARMAEHDDGRQYVRFLGALSRGGEPWWQLVANAFAPQWQRFESVFERAVPSVPAEVKVFRYSVLSAVLLDPLLAVTDPRYAGMEFLHGTRLEDAVVDVLVGALTAPSTPPPSRSKQ